MSKEMVCGGKRYRVSDDARCVDGKVTGSAKTYLGKAESLASQINFGGSKGRKASPSSEKSIAEYASDFAKAGMKLITGKSDQMALSSKILLFCIVLGDSPDRWDMEAEVVQEHEGMSSCHVAITENGFKNPNDVCFCVETESIRR